MQINKFLASAVLAIAIAAPIVLFLKDSSVSQPTTSTESQMSFLHGPSAGQSSTPAELASLERAIEWINTPPVKAASLRGKVVLVDFWTYTCVNWLRTLPYVRAWDEKYKDQGLVVIGVHTPEFAFERKSANVKTAVADLKIGYPVAVDNAYRIWRAFDNSYWPAHYFIDAQGRLRHHHFGEGEYDESERVIQQLLAEAGRRDMPATLVSVDASGAE